MALWVTPQHLNVKFNSFEVAYGDVGHVRRAIWLKNFLDKQTVSHYSVQQKSAEKLSQCISLPSNLIVYDFSINVSPNYLLVHLLRLPIG